MAAHARLPAVASRLTPPQPRPLCIWPAASAQWEDDAMSARTRSMPRRSCLSVPGSSERFLAKAPGVPADMTFLDLEDAVAPLEKEAARAKVVSAIRELAWDDRVLCVRVNAWDTRWTYGDVIEVVSRSEEHT